MRSTLLEMLQSKKAIAMLLGVLAWGLGHLGLRIDADKMTEMIMPIIAYIIGQGIADHGKEAAKVAIAAQNKLLESGALVQEHDPATVIMPPIVESHG